MNQLSLVGLICFYIVFVLYCLQRRVVYYSLELLYAHNQNYSICADYDVVLRMYLDGRTFKKVPVIINNYGTNGVSSLHPIKAYWKNYGFSVISV